MPIALAAAVGSDWSMSLWTIALFAVMEPLTGQVVEPLVCGRSAGLLYPSAIRAHVGASLTARLAGEPRFDIGKPDVIRPSIGVDRRRVAALVIGAIHQDAANAAGTHVSEGDFGLADGFRHGP